MKVANQAWYMKIQISKKVPCHLGQKGKVTLIMKAKLHNSLEITRIFHTQD